MVKNVFVAGLDDFHLAQLTSLKQAEHYCFHPLMSYEEIKCGDTFPVKKFLEHSQQTFDSFTGTIDAIVGYWDFPVSTVLPLVRKIAGLDGPTLESVLKCEHKLWSRLVQAESVPHHIPTFTAINPFSNNAIKQCHIPYPFWLKPVKSVLSHLGFLITDPESFRTALETTRKNIERYASPFNHILNFADLPPEIKEIDGYYCIAESLISKGHQCTLEGYVFNGDVHIYGAVDSVRGGRLQTSFTRYQYPSALPPQVLDRMEIITRKFLSRTEYNNAPFNIEFYWNEDLDHISLLEVNTRISKSHVPLFKMVDGEYHHAVMLDLALGRRPDFPSRMGQFQVAAKFMLRRYEDGLVKKIPEKKDLQRVKHIFPGTEVIVSIKAGMRLSDLRDQDSYSYDIADLFMGAASHKQLLDNYNAALSMLPFIIE
ncbi:ATP-grasp domain-containing protein [Desulforhopalus sp. 52FAK]